MVKRQIEARGVTDPKVLAAMHKVPRHLFVSDALRDQAYGDFPLPIGEQQTISQPYIVAEMTQALQPGKDDRILEIGTGSGYQAAILAEIVFRVYTIEKIHPLYTKSRNVFDKLHIIILSPSILTALRAGKTKAPLTELLLQPVHPAFQNPLSASLL